MLLVDQPGRAPVTTGRTVFPQTSLGAWTEITTSSGDGQADQHRVACQVR